MKIVDELFPKAGLLIRIGKAVRGKIKKRRAKKRRAEQQELPLSTDEGGDPVSKLAELSAKLRTSTKGGAVGAVPAVAVLLPMFLPQVPGYDAVEALMQQACASEQGPTVFLAGCAVTWVAFWVAARRSKTPAKPGVL